MNFDSKNGLQYVYDFLIWLHWSQLLVETMHFQSIVV